MAKPAMKGNRARVSMPVVGRGLPRGGGANPIAPNVFAAYIRGTPTAISPRPLFPVHAFDFPGFRSSGERVIFAVDDDEDDRLLLGRLLEEPGLEYPCRFFSNGGQMMDALLKV